jgi:hypothetical protein
MRPRNRRTGRHSIYARGGSSRAGRSARHGPVGRAMTVVRTGQQLRLLEADLLGARHYPIVLLALAVDADEPAFAPRQLHTAAGRRISIYLLQGQYPLQRPAVLANQRWAVPRGSARVCWPRFSVDSDPDDHPCVHRLDRESDRDALEEFARKFDLSRPRVRRELKLIEGLRASSEHELKGTRSRVRELERQLRDAYRERDVAIRRVERAERASKREGRVDG